MAYQQWYRDFYESLTPEDRLQWSFTPDFLDLASELERIEIMMSEATDNLDTSVPTVELYGEAFDEEKLRKHGLHVSHVDGDQSAEWVRLYDEEYKPIRDKVMEYIESNRVSPIARDAYLDITSRLAAERAERLRA